MSFAPRARDAPQGAQEARQEASRAPFALSCGRARAAALSAAGLAVHARRLCRHRRRQLFLWPLFYLGVSGSRPADSGSSTGCARGICRAVRGPAANGYTQCSSPTSGRCCRLYARPLVWLHVPPVRRGRPRRATPLRWSPTSRSIASSSILDGEAAARSGSRSSPPIPSPSSSASATPSRSWSPPAPAACGSRSSGRHVSGRRRVRRRRLVARAGDARLARARRRAARRRRQRAATRRAGSRRAASRRAASRSITPGLAHAPGLAIPIAVAGCGRCTTGSASAIRSPGCACASSGAGTAASTCSGASTTGAERAHAARLSGLRARFRRLASSASCGSGADGRWRRSRCRRSCCFAGSARTGSGATPPACGPRFCRSACGWRGARRCRRRCWWRSRYFRGCSYTCSPTPTSCSSARPKARPRASMRIVAGERRGIDAGGVQLVGAARGPIDAHRAASTRGGTARRRCAPRSETPGADSAPTTRAASRPPADRMCRSASGTSSRRRGRRGAARACRRR